MREKNHPAPVLWAVGKKKMTEPSKPKNQKRLGVSPTEVSEEITILYQNTPNGEALAAVLKQRGYTLIRSTRRVLFVIDRQGGEHNLFARIAAPSEEIKKKLSDLNPTTLPQKKTRERETFIKCFLTAQEKTEVKAKASQAELTVSAYMRSLIYGKNTPQAKASRRPAPEKEELINLRYELRKIGGNLNQIAHLQNQGKGFNNTAFTQLCAQHTEALKAIMSALGKDPAT